MKQVRCGEDVKKIDQRDKGGRGEDTSREVSSTPREGTKEWEENDHPSFQLYISTDTQTKIIHSVRLDISRRTADEPRTQSKIHYFPFIQITLIYQTYSDLF